MASRDEGFEETVRVQREQHLTQLSHDFNNESAGRDVGRIKRFNFSNSKDILTKQREQESQSLLMVLLANQAYRESYERVMNTIQDLEVRIVEALTANIEAIEETERALEEAMSRANRLPDGTLFFVNTQGQAFSADGRGIEQDEIAHLELRPDASSWEELVTLRARLAQLRERHFELIEFQGEVDHERGRIENEDDPLEIDELNHVNVHLQDRAIELLTVRNAEVSQEVQPTAIAPELEFGPNTITR